jgi:uncharacterized protein (TIGR02996 family)
MSEEDAFLDGIAADRADRTRLLVFADWLADRSDPREKFVRAHVRLLDMDGTERAFAQFEKVWASWTGGIPFIDVGPTKLNARWLDAICRVCTTAEVEEYAENGRDPEPLQAESFTFGPEDHIHFDTEVTLNLYHGRASSYTSPLEFVSETLLVDLWEDPFLEKGAKALASCHPLTRGRFWKTWRELRGNLHEPPPLPKLAAGNYFLGAQHISGNEDNWGMVATYRDDYFALFWSV